MLKGILAIAGQPGLFKLISQSKSGIIVESLENGKRVPIASSTKVSSLEDIAIYTYDEEIPLAAVFAGFISHTKKAATPVGKKSSDAELRSYFETVLPNYDKERVYVSDIKKVISWYNLLLEKGLLDGIEKALAELESAVKAEAEKQEEEAKVAEEPAEKAPAKKRTTKKKEEKASE